ncbi:MAG: DUF6011 domain-containing protein [Syntrophothermus sp.]|jgi:hypothetical protein
MEQQARCKKCGRILKSPQSIALGMGSTCAGMTSSASRATQVRQKRSSGKPYKIDYVSKQKISLTGDLSTKPLTSRQIREQRRRLFEERKPFRCGIFAKTRKPLIYVPTENGLWKEDWSGREISHDRLKGYLRKYQFI